MQTISTRGLSESMNIDRNLPAEQKRSMNPDLSQDVQWDVTFAIAWIVSLEVSAMFRVLLLLVGADLVVAVVARLAPTVNTKTSRCYINPNLTIRSVWCSMTLGTSSRLSDGHHRPLTLAFRVHYKLDHVHCELGNALQSLGEATIPTDDDVGHFKESDDGFAPETEKLRFGVYKFSCSEELVQFIIAPVL